MPKKTIVQKSADILLFRKDYFEYKMHLLRFVLTIEECSGVPIVSYH